MFGCVQTHNITENCNCQYFNEKKEVKAIKTTDFGKAVKHRLVDMDLSQNWLIEEVKKKTGLYFDSSYLQKILNGKSSAPKLVDAIAEILNIEDVQKPEKWKAGHAYAT